MHLVGVIAISQDLAGERVHWESIAGEFGFSIQFIDTEGVQDLGSNLIAVIVDYGKRSAIDHVKRAGNGQAKPRLVLCHGMASPLEDAEFHAAGAFDVLARPLADAEVRQTMGFLWRAVERS